MHFSDMNKMTKNIMALMMSCLLAEGSYSNSFAGELPKPVHHRIYFSSEALQPGLLQAFATLDFKTLRSRLLRQETSQTFYASAQPLTLRPLRKGTLLEGLRDFVHPYPEDGDVWCGWDWQFLELIKANRFWASKFIAQNGLRGLHRLGLIQRTKHRSNEYHNSAAPWLEAAWKYAQPAIEAIVFPDIKIGAAFIKPLAVWRLQTEEQHQAALQVVMRIRLAALQKILQLMEFDSEEILRLIQSRENAHEIIEDLGWLSNTPGGLSRFKDLVLRIIQGPGRSLVNESFIKALHEGKFNRSILQVHENGKFIGTAFVGGYVEGHYILMTAAHVVSHFNPDEKISIWTTELKPVSVGQAVCVTLGKGAFSKSDVAWLILPDDPQHSAMLIPLVWGSSVASGDVVTLPSIHPQQKVMNTGYAWKSDGFLSTYGTLGIAGNSGSPLLVGNGNNAHVVAVLSAYVGETDSWIQLNQELLLDAQNALSGDNKSEFRNVTTNLNLQRILNDYLVQRLAAQSPPVVRTSLMPQNARPLKTLEKSTLRFERKKFRHLKQLQKAWRAHLLQIRKANFSIKFNPPVEKTYQELNIRFAKAWLKHKQAFGLTPSDRLEPSDLHPNDLVAGLTPEDTIGDRDNLHLSGFRPGIPLSADVKDLVRSVNIHPIVFGAIIGLNAIPEIKTVDSGPDSIFSFIPKAGWRRVVRQLTKAAEGLPLEIIFYVSNTVDHTMVVGLKISSRVKLRDAKKIWDTFVDRLKKNSSLVLPSSRAAALSA